MKKKQYEIFLKSEADDYYKRNKEGIINVKIETDVPTRILEMYKIKPKKVLEIGCMDGYRLNFLYQKYGCDCTGIEPSEAAVKQGNNKYKNIKLIKGIFSEIPLDEKFDLIIINFVFHWIDRDLLAKCVSEVERLLKAEGFLLICDFFPDFPRKNKYNHLPDDVVWTFKQEVLKFF